jgi:hypothetical protein
VKLFRRRAPLHERLARDGRVTQERGGPPPHDTMPRWGTTAIHGLHRLREWDVVVTAHAPALAGERVRFVSVPGDELIVEEETGEGDLTPLARAVEAALAPPYRAVAARQDGDLWAVAARTLELARLPADFGAEQVILSVRDGERVLEIDGFGSIRPLPALERLGEERFAGAPYAIRARRLDDEFWEVELWSL